MKKIGRIILAGFAVAVLALGSSCSSKAMKGTPFYNGEYPDSLGDAEDRVNLWPLLYYRSPALSILWPLMEFSNNHIALRPLFSIYNRDQDHPTYNLLWPLGHFDTNHKDYRFFPVFWGKRYCVAFPLYWHFGKPLDNHGSDTLFPLWSYSSHSPDHYNLHLLWPVFNRRNISDSDHGGRIWPLFGSYKKYGRTNSFALWPLGHRWRDGSKKGSCLIPIYYHDTDGDDSTFISLPYSASHHGDIDWQTLLPLYHRRTDASGKSFYSLLYSSSTNSLTESSWSLAVPLWYRHKSPQSSITATLLGGIKSGDDRTGWFALPLLSGGVYSKTGSDSWILGPLAHRAYDSDSGTSQSHIFPLYYKSSSPESSSFYSLLWSSSTNTASAWQLLAPIYYHHTTPDTSTTITPLYAWGSDASTGEKWHGIVPIALNRRTPTEHLFATPLGGYNQTTNSTSWLVWPLLSGGSKSSNGSSVWALAPLIHASWNGNNSSSHVLPVYYWNGFTRNFISLLYTHWNSEKSTTEIIPPLLSWRTKSPKCSDTWILGPLAHFSSGEDASSSHIFPIYYHNRASQATVTLPYASFKSGQTDYKVFPLLLAMLTTHASTKNLYILAGLFRQQWGKDATSISRLWPIYDYRAKKHFYTLLFGWRKGRYGFVYPATPLIGIRTGDYSGGWVFPLWSRRQNRITGDTTGTFLWGTYSHHKDYCSSGIFPLYGYHRTPNSTRLWSLPACWYNHSSGIYDKSSTLSHGCFPLWSQHTRTLTNATGEITEEHSHGSLLLLLYDHKHAKVAATKDEPATDYVRRRILWRLWHYERLNGDVSIDIFPAITYDTKTNGFHKVSFLWRLFRYEKGPKGKKFDLLFIPLIRSHKK